MPDSGFIFSPAFRVVDASINAVAGGTLEFYEAGTSTAKTVYSDPTLSTSLGSIVYLDSAGHPVSAQGGSTKVIIYTGSALVKMIVKDSDGATVATYDNLRCAQDTSSFGTGDGGSGISGVLAKASDYTVLEANDGYWIDGDPTGGTFTITLPGAADVGDGFAFGIRHAGTTTTNAVRFATVGGDTISMDGITTTAGALTGGGEAAWFVSNGANWRVITHTPPRLSMASRIEVVDRVTVAPVGPAAGSYYIVSGTPTGDWLAAGYAEHDLLRSNGVGGWTRFTPPANCGWTVYVKDESMDYRFTDSSWVALSNITAPAATVLGRVEASYVVSDGSNGGAIGASNNTAYTRALNTLDVAEGTLSGVILNTNQLLNVPAGTYLVSVSLAFGQVDRAQFWLRGTTAGVLQRSIMNHHNTADSSNAGAHMTCIVTLAADDTIYIENMASNNASATTAAGLPNTATGFSEVYARISIVDLTATQGPRGTQGNNGADGADGSDGVSAGLIWNFASSTTMGDPSSGNVRLNNATLSSVTAAAVSDNCGEAGNPDVAAWVLSWDDSTNTSNRGYFTLRKDSNFAIYTISGASTDNSGWTQLALTYVSHSGSFSASDQVSLSVARAGDVGATGATGATGSTGPTGPAGGVDSVNGLTGVVVIPIRDTLSGNRTYYIRTDGSDSNNGLANTSGGAFLTLNKLFNVLAAIDLNGYTVACNVAAGTYAGSVTVKGPVGIGTVTMTGDTGTPANVVISGTVRYSDWPARIQMRGMKFTAAAPIVVTNANLYLEAIEFGGSGPFMEATRNGLISVFGAVRFVAGGSFAFAANYGGKIFLNNSAINAVTSTAFSFWVRVSTGGLVAASAISVTGTTTGTRHYVNALGLLEAAGTMPGDVAGSTATGGQVV